MRNTKAQRTQSFQPLPLNEIVAARERIKTSIVRTPLIPFPVDDTPTEIFLKLENLQPIGSFKIRGAANAILSAKREDLADGVWTASAGNMAQGVAWNARRLGLRCTVVVPDHAPEAKLQAITRLGADIIKVPFAEWWQIITSHQFERAVGFFIHPVCNRDVIAGNGTIGLEILEDIPAVDAIVIPYGGGGLSTGIASAIRELKPSTTIFACEVNTAAPLAASLAAGQPVSVEYVASFVDGIGGKSMLPEMWEAVRALIDDSIVLTLQQVEDAIRMLAQRAHIIAEGAGATSVAAALSGRAGTGKVVCVVSGGNINMDVLAAILQHKDTKFTK